MPRCKQTIFFLFIVPPASYWVHFIPVFSNSLVCWVWCVQGGEDVVGGVGQTWGGGEVVAVEVDGDLLEGFEGADDAFDSYSDRKSVV